MEKEHKEFIAKRCEKALLENQEYLEKERNNDVSETELQEMAEVICYKKGFMDAMELRECYNK